MRQLCPLVRREDGGLARLQERDNALKCHGDMRLQELYVVSKREAGQFHLRQIRKMADSEIEPAIVIEKSKAS